MLLRINLLSPRLRELLIFGHKLLMEACTVASVARQMELRDCQCLPTPRVACPVRAALLP
jgi:hypothetical protein